MSLLWLLFSFVPLDAEFVKTLLGTDDSAWQTLADDSIPPDQHLAVFADLTNQLALSVPRSFLKDNAVHLEGNVTFVIQYDERTPLYRCKMELNNGTAADVFVSSVPDAWTLNEPMHERATAFGVAIKSYKGVAVFAAPAIAWFPDTWLGNLGFDVGSFDQVPVSRVIDEELAKHDEETNRRMFKFTESDSEPFYGLLRAISATPSGWLEEEAKKQHTEQPISATDLFNRPQETRGKPVLLRGTAKRVLLTPVTDSEVQSLFGIDHYYQIYLFTEQSQGNPIVVCVRSLPEGMPVGDTADFAESITVAAVPYKLWIYETPTGPHYAPILVGSPPVWHPQSVAKRPLPESYTTISFAVFFTLVLIWFASRYWFRLPVQRRSRKR